LQRWVIAAGPGDDRADRSGGLECFSLDVSAAERDRLQALLSDEERARAARFHAELHQHRFTVAHARLRQTLAAALRATPKELEFVAGSHGKPQLADAWASCGLQFNLSHSGNCALVGWLWDRAIGVDIELWRPMNDAPALVRRFFSPVEIAAWEALPAEAREEAFFNCWTRKEAYVKAVGRGLSLPLDSFDVSLGRGSSARLLRASRAMDDGRLWNLHAIDVGPQISAAVVVEGEPHHVRIRNLSATPVR
jgi:4'-phosphopantetheinyl transferase